MAKLAEWLYLCQKCGLRKYFKGRTLDEASDKARAAGWKDMGGDLARCPSCKKFPPDRY